MVILVLLALLVQQDLREVKVYKVCPELPAQLEKLVLLDRKETRVRLDYLGLKVQLVYQELLALRDLKVRKELLVRQEHQVAWDGLEILVKLVHKV